MNVKIDRADYTILYGVSEEQWPAWLLLKEETIGGVNRFWPGLPARELTEHFFRLWSEELIECAEGEDEPAIAPDYELARQQFEFDTSSSDRPQANILTYRLSAVGGDTWASYAGVDWSKFFSSWYDSGRNEFRLSASDRRAIELALQLRKISPPPVPGTERWEILGPWPPIGKSFRPDIESATSTRVGLPHPHTKMRMSSGHGKSCGGNSARIGAAGTSVSMRCAKSTLGVDSCRASLDPDGRGRPYLHS
ncbi:MAG: hypothetical protein DMG93_08000 [Acidobacteria bacterium]|nr:MAG: hypothetical protein DMG93_08000 [Acidobacteriota bacterium]